MGTHDKLIPSAFGRQVAEWLPGAEQIVLEGCGHVPQIERPDQTNGLLRRFFARADALPEPRGAGRRRRGLDRLGRRPPARPESPSRALS